MSTSATVFQKHARGMDARRPDEAAIARRSAEDPFVLSLIPDDSTWDVPARLMAAVQWLVLGDEVLDYRVQADPWSAFLDFLHEHEGWVVRFVHRQGIQTNETQRCFALLPLFLTVARTVGKPLDLLELGTSGGLNLIWDRYHYRYREGTWGSPDSGLELTGEEIVPVPRELLTQEVTVARRRGIDLNPVDVTTDDGFRLLASFLGADRVREERLRQAAAVLGPNPPELIRGDYLEILPQLLRERDHDNSITVVFQTISTIYLRMEQRIQLREIMEAAGQERAMAWISTPTPEEHGQRRGDYPMELSIWPPGERRIVARMSNSGDSLEWIG